MSEGQLCKALQFAVDVAYVIVLIALIGSEGEELVWQFQCCIGTHIQFHGVISAEGFEAY